MGGGGGGGNNNNSSGGGGNVAGQFPSSPSVMLSRGPQPGLVCHNKNTESFGVVNAFQKKKIICFKRLGTHDPL